MKESPTKTSAACSDKKDSRSLAAQHGLRHCAGDKFPIAELNSMNTNNTQLSFRAQCKHPPSFRVSPKGESRNLFNRPSINSPFILQCRGENLSRVHNVKCVGALYAGVTGNITRRLHEHKNHLIPGSINKYDVTRLVYFETIVDATSAIEREKQINGFSGTI